MERGDEMNRKELLEELKKYMNHLIRMGDEMPLEVWLDDYSNNVIDIEDMAEIGYHLRYACEYISKYVDR